MSKVRHNVTLNVLIPGLIPEVELTELDSGHQICFHIAGMDLSGYTATIWVVKPSGKRCYNACTVDGQRVIADITNQMLAEKGRCKGQIKLTSTADGLVTPGDFILDVQCDLSGDGLESKNESTVFENMMADIMENMGIDATLTKVGYAADAAAVGKKLSQLSEQIGNQTGLTQAQITALDGMFKVTAYDSSKDYSGAYTAFKQAFGIESGGETEVTLSSISATYSGGSVLVGTSVNDLTGIVVTARYSDGTTETVTGYTLSGTIVEGSNTVTISYGGKSTTITVIGYTEGEEEITLTSISATYTGGEVAVGTALTSLTGITVTGTYSDESTFEITGYTLSGEIMEGTNTITVTYSGLTTTFTVTGVAESSGEETGVSNETTWTDGVAYTYTAVEDSYVETNGVITAYNSWARTPYLYCDGASKVRVKVIVPSVQYSNGNDEYNCFYDENKNFIQSFAWTGVSTTEAGSYVDIDIPENAVYLILSGKNAAIIGNSSSNYVSYLEFTPYA